MQKDKIATSEIYIMCRAKNVSVGENGTETVMAIEPGKPAFLDENAIAQFAEKDLSLLELTPVKLTVLIGVV